MFRTRPLTEGLIYVALSFAIALGIALAFPHAELARLMSALIPVTSVTIMTFTVFRRGQRKAMWAGIGLNRLALRWWPVAIVIPFVLMAIAYGAAVVLNVAEVNNPSGLFGWIAANGVGLVLNLVIGAIVIMGEEIGWRGFLLPRLQTAMNGRPAALLTGLIHGLFHLPLILLTSVYDNIGSRWVIAPVAVLVITGGGVTYAWLRDRSQSVWPVAVAHNVVNTVFELGSLAVVAASPVALAYVAGEGGLATAAAVWLVAGVLLGMKSQWNSRRPTAGPIVEEIPSVVSSVAGPPRR
jgi:membrane protease YdiL (CAAX protease family)